MIILNSANGSKPGGKIKRYLRFLAVLTPKRTSHLMACTEQYRTTDTPDSQKWRGRETSITILIDAPGRRPGTRKTIARFFKD